MKNSIKLWLQKFSNAARGIYISLTEEKTLIIYLILSVIAIILGVVFKLKLIEWMVLVLVVGISITFEFMNTAIENLLDFIEFKYNKSIKKIKDIFAASSFILSITAIILFGLIFIPHIIKTIQGL